MAFWNRNDTAQQPSPAPSRTPAPKEPPKPNPPKSTPPPLPALAEPAPFLRPSLGSDTSVTGKLSFASPTRIDGRLKGEVRANDLLLIGENGSVEGIVHAKALILEGSVKGDIIGTEWVQVLASGRLVGSVEANRIQIEHGAKVQARMSIVPPTAKPADAASRPNRPRR